ncbi:Crp/Fnr family transcriptional regulator [Pseudofulvibacter geojedonensis]|uniref:Crp/Fnr family transcriptional regulator n=1 Tax=Pseudofulvibacter geojedonensis TaxID=1123758 RepID=A0ABW3I3P3_9FLAO
MFEKVHQAINKISPLSNEAFGLISPFFKQAIYPKNTLLCKAGEVPTDFYFINSGVMRGYTETPKGVSYNTSIFHSHQFSGPKSALILKKPSRINYETLTECDLISIDYDKMMELCQTNHEILKLSHRLLELYFVSLERRAITLGSLNAKERYLAMKKRFKQFENDIPQYHIASLLGITPIQLSRIRRELAQEA